MEHSRLGVAPTCPICESTCLGAVCVSCPFSPASRHVHVFVWAPCVIGPVAHAAMSSAHGSPSASQGRACLCASQPHVYPCYSPFRAPVPSAVPPRARISGHSLLVLMRADAGGRAVPVCTHARFSPFWVHTLEHTSFCFLSPSSEDSAWEPPAPEASPSFSMPLTHCPATSAQEPVCPPSAQGRPRPRRRADIKTRISAPGREIV